MAEQPTPLGDPAAALALAHHDAEIVQLARVGVLLERLRIAERLHVVAHSAAGEVERHGSETGGGEPVGEKGEEGEAGESLEAVHEHDRRARSRHDARFAANRASRRAFDVESLARERQRRARRRHSWMSPPASTQPRNPESSDATSA